MKLTINVTQENIEKARPSTKCACPIALAVRQLAESSLGALKDTAEASIDHDKGRLHIRMLADAAVGQKGSWEFPLPQVAQDFIRDRDEKSPVAPFSFATTGKLVAA